MPPPSPAMLPPVGRRGGWPGLRVRVPPPRRHYYCRRMRAGNTFQPSCRGSAPLGEYWGVNGAGCRWAPHCTLQFLLRGTGGRGAHQGVRTSPVGARRLLFRVGDGPGDVRKEEAVGAAQGTWQGQSCDVPYACSPVPQPATERCRRRRGGLDLMPLWGGSPPPSAWLSPAAGCRPTGGETGGPLHAAGGVVSRTCLLSAGAGRRGAFGPP